MLAKKKLKRKTKYRAIRKKVGDITFDSSKEANRFVYLRWLQKSGKISGLTCQVSFEIAPACIIGGKKKAALRYVADFTYWRDGKYIVEDVKGFLTSVYKVKRHLMKLVHGVDILET